MEFRKYMHIERFGTDEVDGIELGTCYIFPKIDGTCGSVYMDGGELKAGSRNRELKLEDDNQGFYQYITEHSAEWIELLNANPSWIVYGEYLIPHSLRTYRDEAWKEFYIFDVYDTNSRRYIPYEEYSNILRARLSFKYITPLKIIKNGSLDAFLKCTEANTYLIKTGEGVGEGIVIKNYEYANKYGRPTWAKMVRAEFKDTHRAVMGSPESEYKMVEVEIVEKYITVAYIEKEHSKIRLDRGGWSSKMIPEFLGRIWHDFIVEYSWAILKDFRMPKVDYKLLHKAFINKVKESKPELF